MPEYANLLCECTMIWRIRPESLHDFGQAEQNFLFAGFGGIEIATNMLYIQKAFSLTLPHPGDPYLAAIPGFINIDTQATTRNTVWLAELVDNSCARGIGCNRRKVTDLVFGCLCRKRQQTCHNAKV
jgi:hypothetical protein